MGLAAERADCPRLQRNATWTNLTQAVTGAQENTWYEIASDKITNMNAYRYIRLFNGTAWYGNVAEVEFYGDYDFSAVPKVIGPDGYTKGSYYLYQKEIERINAAVSQPGADKQALLVQLLQADGLLVPITAIYPKIAITPSMVLAATASTDGKADAAANGWRAFDGDTNTFPDTTIAAGWVQADLGAATQSAWSHPVHPENRPSQSHERSAHSRLERRREFDTSYRSAASVRSSGIR